jgi:hypothetical protein
MSEVASGGWGIVLDETHDFDEIRIVPFLCVRHA